MSADIDKERELFEAAHPDYEYNYDSSDTAWDGWLAKARASQPTGAQGVEKAPRISPSRAPLKRCAASRDGDCTHPECPQLRDNEPHATGRHCPIDTTTI